MGDLTPEELDRDLIMELELELDSPRSLIIVVYDDEKDTVEVENPDGLPRPFVLGILQEAVEDLRFGPCDHDEDE